MDARSLTFGLSASLLGALLLLALLEAAIALALRTPAGTGPAAFERARRRFYMSHERQIVQFRPECAEYDSELGYRLRPGRCRFSNREFDVEFAINSLGLRDSEDALEAPRIVVTGDSFAMGWGVAQSKTLAAALGRLTGEKTLNAAVASYGTARQLIGLGRLDFSAAHSLVIQYCENDYFENQSFHLSGGRLRALGPDKYEGVSMRHLEATRYLPGKYLGRFVPLWWSSREAPSSDPVRDCALDAEAFLGALEVAKPPALPPGASLRVVVFEGMYSLDRPACFAHRLEPAARRLGLPEWISHLDAIDSSALLEVEDYFPLDQHLRASGYRKIAAAIAERLSRPIP